jgi:cysteine desulfurase
VAHCACRYLDGSGWLIEEARARVAALIGATPEEIVFTATGSEANNLALKGVMGAATLAAPRGASGGRGAGVVRRRIVISAIEHPSVLETAHALEDSGHEVTVVPVGPDGVLDPAQVALALGNDVALVSVMLVNNETGTIQPVAEIARAAHDHGPERLQRGAMTGEVTLKAQHADRGSRGSGLGGRRGQFAHQPRFAS